MLAIDHGRLLAAARVGELCPKQQGKGGGGPGRGKIGIAPKKKLPLASQGSFSSDALALYRKVATHKGRIAEYVACGTGCITTITG
jgi:hypothetical protein